MIEIDMTLPHPTHVNGHKVIRIGWSAWGMTHKTAYFDGITHFWYKVEDGEEYRINPTNPAPMGMRLSDATDVPVTIVSPCKDLFS